MCFVFDLETCMVEKLAVAYAAGFYDVNCLPDRWDRGSIHEETEIGRKMLLFSMD